MDVLLGTRLAPGTEMMLGDGGIQGPASTFRLGDRKINCIVNCPVEALGVRGAQRCSKPAGISGMSLKGDEARTET